MIRLLTLLAVASVAHAQYVNVTYDAATKVVHGICYSKAPVTSTTSSAPGELATSVLASKFNGDGADAEAARLRVPCYKLVGDAIVARTKAEIAPDIAEDKRGGSSRGLVSNSAGISAIAGILQRNPSLPAPAVSRLQALRQVLLDREVAMLAELTGP